MPFIIVNGLTLNVSKQTQTQTLSRLCYYLSESKRGTNTKTMFFSPYIYIYKYSIFSMDVHSWFYFFSIVFFLDSCKPLLESMLLSVFANPSRNWTFQRFARVSEKERTQRKKLKIWHSPGFEPRSFGTSRRYAEGPCHICHIPCHIWVTNIQSLGQIDIVIHMFSKD